MNSYTPGSWAGVNLSDYDVPKMTSIIIIGPKRAGKSSLVNRITRVIEGDEFAPARAQESCTLYASLYLFFNLVSVFKGEIDDFVLSICRWFTL